MKQRKHVTPAPAPICASPGVTWLGRAGSPAHSRENSRAASAAHLASGFSAAESRGIKAGGRTSSVTLSAPFLTLAAAPREISITERDNIWCVGPLCAPGGESPAVVQTPAIAPSGHPFNLILIRTLLQKKISVYFRATERKDDEEEKRGRRHIANAE